MGKPAGIPCLYRTHSRFELVFAAKLHIKRRFRLSRKRRFAWMYFAVIELDHSIMIRRIS